MAARTHIAREGWQPPACSYCLPVLKVFPQQVFELQAKPESLGLGHVSIFSGANKMQLQEFIRHLLVYALQTPQSWVRLDIVFALHQLQDLLWGGPL